MIVGSGKNLEKVGTILSNNINSIFVCKDKDAVNKNNIEYYTLIKIHDANVIKDVLEVIYKKDKNNISYNLPQSLFCDIFVEIDTLNILMKYREPQKLFLYLKSYMTTEYSQHMIIKNFIYQCLSLDIDYKILDLMLDKDNINLNKDYSVFFNGFLDFSKFNKNADERVCVKKCCDLISNILESDDELTNKSKVKSINLFIKKQRNNSYNKLIDLYNDFKIKETRYKTNKESFWVSIRSYFDEVIKYRLKKILVRSGLILIVLALTILICDLFRLDLPFAKYQGLNVIGTVNMGER